MGAGRGGCGWYAEGRLGVGYGRNGDGDGQMIRWEYTVANVILGTEPNAPLAYAPGSELHNPIISILGGYGGRLDIYIYSIYSMYINYVYGI